MGNSSTPVAFTTPFLPTFTSRRSELISNFSSSSSSKCKTYQSNRTTPTMVQLTRESSEGTVKRVVVTGAGIVSCFGTDLDVYYDSLLAGKSGIRKIDTFECENWSTNFAGIIHPDHVKTEGYVSPKLSRRLDPFLTYALIAGKKALENANIGLDSEDYQKLDKTRAGVLCGSGMGGVRMFSTAVEKLVTKGHERMSPFFIPYAITNMAAALLAMDLDFKGPNYSISTACATGNYAINNAAVHIRRGECDLCLAGASESSIEPVGVGGFIACRALSSRRDEPQKASRPWDKSRDGFVMGEGAGLIVLESLEHALNRGAPILCEYLGGAQSCDAHHITEPRQDGSGVRLCLNNAIERIGIDKQRINYINAHATSTQAGDLAEFKAVRSVFDGDVSHIKMNSTKSMIGHGLGAASAMEAIATVKAIEKGIVHPTINVTDKEDEVDMDIVDGECQKHDIDVGISNSFGFGGHNSTVMFTKYTEEVH